MKYKIGLAPESFKAEWGFGSNDYVQPFLDTVVIERAAGRGDWVAAQVIIDVNENTMLNVGKRLALSKHGAWLQLRADVRTDGLGNAKMNIIGYIEDDDRSFRADILLNDDTAELTPGKLG